MLLFFLLQLDLFCSQIAVMIEPQNVLLDDYRQYQVHWDDTRRETLKANKLQDCNNRFFIDRPPLAVMNVKAIRSIYRSSYKNDYRTCNLIEREVLPFRQLDQHFTFLRLSRRR